MDGEIKRGAQPPIKVPLSAPVNSLGRVLHEVTIGRRRNGYDVLMECALDTDEEVKLLRVQRLCDLAVGSEQTMLASDVRVIHAAILAMEGDIEAAEFPYRLRFPVGSLAEIGKPRDATGADMIAVGREGRGSPESKMALYAERLCGLTREQFGALDAEDVQALMLGVVPFWFGSPDQGSAPASSPASA